MSDVHTTPEPDDAEFNDFVQLLKPRVMSLVVFTALVGLLVAPKGLTFIEGFCVGFIHSPWRWGLWGAEYVVGRGY